MIMWRKFVVDRYCRPVQDKLTAKLKLYDTEYEEYFYISFFDKCGNAYMNMLFEGEVVFYVSAPGKYEVEIYRGEQLLKSYRTDIYGQGVQ